MYTKPGDLLWPLNNHAVDVTILSISLTSIPYWTPKYSSPAQYSAHICVVGVHR